MPITTVKYGKHENVKFVEMGDGDVYFVPGKQHETSRTNLLIIAQGESGEIAREIPGLKGKNSDEIDGLQIILKFNNPKSISSLIHSLVELQESML